MASDVAVNGKCLQEYQLLKLKKAHRYIVFNLNKDNTEIVVEKVSSAPGYADFVADLPALECRWAVYDFEFEKDGSGKRNKLVFVLWSPDNARVKQKMVFASAGDALRRSLEGIHEDVQGTDYDEVSYEAVLDKVARRL
ncbi:actin-binding ADF family protein [Streptomyces sp. NPDC127061]|uniref:actin-binding ADF family protein n=1 Tax=Streptomyces sp. NPDC127061 TaxID=3347122 RepID=UPI00365DCC3F